jgi:MFS family permease
MVLAIILNAVLTRSILNQDIVLLVFAGILWSIYYEFCSFSVNNYLVISEKGNSFVYDWSLITIVYNIGSIIGPILASFIIDDFFLILLIFQLLSLLSISLVGLLTPHNHVGVMQSKFKQTINLIRELEIWKTIIPKVLPLIIFSISIGVIDSVYWTIGGLYAEELFANEEFVWLPIVLYSIPFIFGSLIMAKLNIQKRKKFTSQILLGISSIIIIFFLIPNTSTLFALTLILISSLFLALAEPLNDAVYSDLLKRLGKNMEHLIGVKKVSYSIAYLIGPLLAGFLSQNYGYSQALGSIGILILVFVIIQLVLTPRKIKLPQQQLVELIN